MADILIRGMEMPQRCKACRFCGFGGRMSELNVCMFTGESQPTLSQERMSKCPLAPLPEGHGRLGDLETAEAILHNKAFDLAGTSAEYNALNWALRQIKALPTIIEADLEWKMKNCCCFSNTDQAEGGGEDG